MQRRPWGEDRRATTRRRRVVVRRGAGRPVFFRPAASRVSAWARWWPSVSLSALFHVAVVSAMGLWAGDRSAPASTVYTVVIPPSVPAEAVLGAREAGDPEDAPRPDELPSAAMSPEDIARAGASNYWAGVRAAIARKVRYPAGAARLHEEGVVVVQLSIDSRGRLENVALQGDPPSLLADSALAAVRRAAPFAPPTGVVAGSRTAILPVRFSVETPHCKGNP